MAKVEKTATGFKVTQVETPQEKAKKELAELTKIKKPSPKIEDIYDLMYKVAQFMILTK